MTPTITWGDGYLSVSPFFPESLKKKLTYWHRSICYDEAQHRRVATGERRDLYQLKNYLDDQQQPAQQLLTMPGFLYRIKALLTSEGWSFNIVDQRTPPPEPNILEAMRSLREYQLEGAYVALKSGGGIIACPTGWGKTWLMSALVKAYPHKVLRDRGTPLAVIATPEKDITRKDYMDLTAQLPDREVGLVMSGVKNYSDDVQVITLDSLHLIDPDDIGLLIVDEVHTAATDTRTDVILGARKAIRYGVSATPSGRFDGRDMVTEGLFGPVVYSRSYQQGVQDGALVPIHVVWLTSPLPDRGIELYLKLQRREAQYRWAVDANKGRCKLIGELLARTPEAHQTLCIMPHLEQLNNIAAHAPGVTCVHAETSADSLVQRSLNNVAAVSAKQRKEYYDAMANGSLRKVMSTYVYKQGVNFPDLNVIINAGGGGSDIVAKQIPGRESRNTETKECAYLVDFWHPWDLTVDEKGKRKPGPVHKDDLSRRKVYDELGFTQTWVENVNDLPFLKQ